MSKDKQTEFEFSVGVEFEKLPKFCPTCLVLGHSEMECSNRIGSRKVLEGRQPVNHNQYAVRMDYRTAHATKQFAAQQNVKLSVQNKGNNTATASQLMQSKGGVNTERSSANVETDDQQIENTQLGEFTDAVNITQQTTTSPVCLTQGRKDCTHENRRDE